MKKTYLIFAMVMLLTLILCVSIGSATIPFWDTCQVIIGGLTNKVPNMVAPEKVAIILGVRLPRVLTVALVGAALSVSGGAMQGLLRNPLADGSTLGVSAGASLGAVISIAFNIQIPGIPGAATTIMSISFAFLAMIIILNLAQKIDFTMSTNTVILVGVIFSMFSSSITSMLVTFAGAKVKNIMFWTMGSFASSSYSQFILMGITLIIAGGILLTKAEELNAFAVGENNARHIGVPVKRIKLQVMVLISALIGIAVSISGTIGFVGLIIPHITRILSGPNHHKLLPLVMLIGAIFLMLADLISRILLPPLELPIGVITSFVGSLVFVYIFYRSRRQI